MCDEGGLYAYMNNALSSGIALCGEFGTYPTN